MRLKKLRWKNCYILKEGEVEFPEKGLILVEGKNLVRGGSNGAGKSSFLNLISVALFEQCSSGLVKDKLIKEGESGALISLVFERDGKEYEVVYKRGRENDWYVKSDGKILKGERLGDTERIIQEILKINYLQYSSIVHLRQGDTLGFLGVGGRERLKMFLDLLGIDIYDRGVEKASENLKMIRYELEKKEEGKKELELVLKRLEERLVVDIEVKRKKLLELKGLYEVVKKDLSSLEEEENLVLEKLDDFEKAIDKKRKEIEGLVGSLGKVEKKLERRKVLSDEIERKRLRMEELEIGLEELKSFVSVFDELKKRFEEKKKDCISLESELRLVRKGKDEFVNLGVGRCSLCGQEVSKEYYETHLKEMEEKIGILESRLSFSLDEKEKLEKELKEVEKKVKEYERRVKECEILRGEVDKLLRELSKEDVDEEEVKLLKEKLEVERKDLEGMEIQYRSVKGNLDSIKGKKTELMKKVFGLEKDIALLENELKEYERVVEEKKSVEKRLKDYEREMNELEVMGEYCKWWVDGFKKLRVYDLSNSVGVMEEMVNKYMGMLFGDLRLVFDIFSFKKGKKGIMDIKDEMKVSVLGSEVDIEGYSGGEKQLMGLAVLLGLNEYFGYNILILDEVFGSLDLENRSRVLGLLEGLRKEKLVLVVTHLEDVKAGVDWDKIWVVQRDIDGSVLWEV